MIPFETLVALAVGELTGAEADAADEHLLACGACAADVERLVAIGLGARDAVREGRTRLFLVERLVEQLEREGLVSRTYRLEPGAVVPCSVGADDVYTLMCLAADVGDAARVDVLRGQERMRDVPVDRARGEVRYVLPSAFLRTLPSGDIRLAVVAVDDAGERPLAEYTLRHTAFRP